LLSHFGIATHEQFCDGDLLHQSSDGSAQRDSMLNPMAHSLRIQGGVAALTDALAADLPADRLMLGTTVTGVSTRGSELAVTSAGHHDDLRLTTKYVAIAVPLRLAAELAFQPSLDDAAMNLLRSTPTWMAGHAKFFAFYDTPFWRDHGLSGSAFSRRGPLAEIHDASPATGGPFALMGFVGVDGPARARMAEGELVEKAMAQLRELFGEDAGRPLHHHVMDWSSEAFTAAPTDRKAPDHHPQYGARPQLSDAWRDTLHFIGSETSLANGGLIEGALQQGLAFANHVIGNRQHPATGVPDAEGGTPHDASMGWDWLDS
jgi:monoamine oxidase